MTKLQKQFWNEKKCYENFRKERLMFNKIPFYHSIKHHKIYHFLNSSVNSRNGTWKIVEVNHSILSDVNSFSLKSGEAIGFKKTLDYRFCLVHLSISNADGTRRFTVESKLKDILLTGASNNQACLQKHPPEVFCKKRCSYTFHKTHRKTLVPEILFQ